MGKHFFFWRHDGANAPTTMSLSPSTSQRVLFHPSRSSRHRVACLALYRALVRKALAVPLDEAARFNLDHGFARRNPIHELIRRQFRRNGDDVSKRLVFAALAAGYKVGGFPCKDHDGIV